MRLRKVLGAMGPMNPRGPRGPRGPMILGLLCLFVLVVSCKEEPLPIEPKVPQRVVLIYMGGDNNLSSETYDKINIITQSWSDAYDGKLFIYSDPWGATPALYEIKTINGEGATQMVESYPEENSADSRVFERVIRKVTTENPAHSYGLVLFSHASGWLPEQTLLRPKSVIIDGTNEMDLVDLAAAIPDGRFDFILFEACFMAGIEVAYELKDKAKYIAASSAEIVSPGFTPVYPQVIGQLFAPEADLKGVIETYYAHCDRQTGYKRSVTFSLIRTEALTELAAWMRDNITHAGKDPRIEMAPVEMNHVQTFDRYTNYNLFFDFQDLYSGYVEAKEKKQLATLMEECVPFKVASSAFMEGANGFQINSHSGLTTYTFQERFPFLNASYRQLKWYKEVWE